MSNWLWVGLIALAFLLTVSILIPDDWLDHLWHSDSDGNHQEKDD